MLVYAVGIVFRLVAIALLGMVYWLVISMALLSSFANCVLAGSRSICYCVLVVAMASLGGC